MAREIEIGTVFEACAEALSAELTKLLGSQLRLRALAPEEILLALATDEATPVAHGRCAIAGDAGEALHLLMPAADAATLAALLAGLDKEQVQERRAAPLEADALEALEKLIGCVAATLGRELRERAPWLAPEGPVALAAPVPPDAGLAGGSFVRIGFVVAIDGLPDGRIDLLLPLALAAMAVGDAPTAADECAPILLVDADSRTPDRARALARALGRPVEAADPAALGPDPIGALAHASALVVAWDLGGRSGLELVESLARHASTRALPLAISAQSATRAMAEAALRAGATAFLLGDYDAEALRSRLLDAVTSPTKDDAAPDARPEHQRPSTQKDSEA